MSALSIVLTGVILWGPTLLFLTTLVPPDPARAALHLITATGLTVLLARILRILLFVPLAPPAAGRHRIVPRYPSLGVLAGAMGAALWLYATWAVNERMLLQAALASVVGLGSVVTAWRYRALGMWGGWLEVEGDRLVVETPRASYRVALTRSRLFRREADGSVLVVTPGHERDTLIVPRGAPGRYWVDDAEGLMAKMERHSPIQAVKSLLVLPEGDP